MSTFIVPPAKTLAIGLGANKPSHVGPPSATLIAIRPLLQKIIIQWIIFSLKENIKKEDLSKGIRWRWSPLFETKAIGGPTNQCDFINAVLIIDGPIMNDFNPSEEASLNLLKNTLILEKDFGRIRGDDSIKWGPRSIDIDLLAWGDLQVKNKHLILPHPRLIERDFVVIPLAAALNQNKTSSPRQLKPQYGWNE